MLQKLLQEFKRTFKDRVSQMLPKIRGGRSNEHNLRKLLSSVQILHLIKNVLGNLSKHLKGRLIWWKCIPRNVFTFKFMKSVGDLDKLAIGSKTDVLCLSFAPVVKPEHEQLSKMSQYLDSQSEYNQNETDEDLDATCMQELPGCVKRFKGYAEANKDSGREISFAWIGFDPDIFTKDKLVTAGEEVFIYLFKNGTFQIFDMPRRLASCTLFLKHTML